MGNGNNKIKEIFQKLDELKTIGDKITFLKKMLESTEDKELQEKMKSTIEFLNKQLEKKGNIQSMGVAPLHSSPVDHSDWSAPVKSVRRQEDFPTDSVVEETSRGEKSIYLQDRELQENYVREIERQTQEASVQRMGVTDASPRMVEQGPIIKHDIDLVRKRDLAANANRIGEEESYKEVISDGFGYKRKKPRAGEHGWLPIE